MEKTQLPVVQKNNLPSNIKKGIAKFGKVVGFSTTTGVLAIAFVASCATIPVFILPSCLGLLYSGQKLLNETLYQSHKDTSFITRKHKGNIKIYQDVISKPDISLKLRGMSTTDKVAFMQLQVIVGISKLSRKDRKGNLNTFETDSHRLIQKAFKKLESIGLLENYSETPKKQLLNKNKDMYSHLILPKLAFRNVKGLRKKVPIYNIKFQLSDKKIDINDPDLLKTFPMVFSKRNGLLSKYNYQIIQNPDGTLSIDHHTDKTMIQPKTVKDSYRSFSNSLKENTPTLQEQRDFSISFQSRNSISTEKKQEEKLIS